MPKIKIPDLNPKVTQMDIDKLVKLKPPISEGEKPLSKRLKTVSDGLDSANKLVMKFIGPIEDAMSEVLPPLSNPKIRDSVNNALEWSREHNLVHWLGNTNAKQRRRDIEAIPRHLLDFAETGLNRLSELKVEGGKRRKTSHPFLITDYAHNDPIEELN